MDAKERRALAREWAARMLESSLNVWEPDDLTEEIGEDGVEAVGDEILKIAHRLRRSSQ